MNKDDGLSVTGKNLKGRRVVIRQSFFNTGQPESRVVHVIGGFGCNPEDRRRAVRMAGLGAGCPRIDRACIERFATDEEIAAAVATGLESSSQGNQ